MATGTKESIAEAARSLLVDDKVKKLTVKDIVEKCHITRQSFYYHFNDIPDLLKWSLEQSLETLKESHSAAPGSEEDFRYFFMLALNVLPDVKRVMETNYAIEIKTLLDGQIRLLFNQIVKENNLYSNLSEKELDIVRRYHSHAIIGVLYDWSPEDDKNIDTIIHTIYLILHGEISPF